MKCDSRKSPVIQLFASEATPGVLLMLAALAALVISNSLLAPAYASFLDLPIEVQLGTFSIAKPLFLWVNDGLMAVFFFLVGLEIKREILEGHLSSMDRAALPLIAACGGIVIPALVFVGINLDSPGTVHGWAIPAATDIAFALGILALMGRGVPVTLKIFLLAVAIIDDLAAIVIIAAFYTDGVSIAALSIAAVGWLALLVLNRTGVVRITPYVLVGVVMWAAVLKSGVHATLAGVLVALMVPIQASDGTSPLKVAEHDLHPWVAFLVLPLFAFANAGVSLEGISLSALAAPLPLGIALGLFIGKQAGVLTFSWLGVKAGLCRLPDGATWLQVYGIACLTGVGFTMSLFIGTLAFDSASQLDQVRLGVLLGSGLSALFGFAVLKSALRQTPGASGAATGHART
ncbi:MAG: Na+/H+ antiporter NhaA [Boseongicola sp. SB0676_bin_33]|nr:Na+/H+ antiporter NhaA [Boseongicola sp. SB0676_bin_33]MYK31357.1 Na+/H+ antiporter NhaA [Boseongicola sp. SB0670_bin_30]